MPTTDRVLSKRLGLRICAATTPLLIAACGGGSHSASETILDASAPSAPVSISMLGEFIGHWDATQKTLVITAGGKASGTGLTTENFGQVAAQNFGVTTSNAEWNSAAATDSNGCPAYSICANVTLLSETGLHEIGADINDTYIQVAGLTTGTTVTNASALPPGLPSGMNWSMGGWYYGAITSGSVNSTTNCATLGTCATKWWEFYVGPSATTFNFGISVWGAVSRDRDAGAIAGSTYVGPNFQSTGGYNYTVTTSTPSGFVAAASGDSYGAVCNAVGTTASPATTWYVDLPFPFSLYDVTTAGTSPANAATPVTASGPAASVWISSAGALGFGAASTATTSLSLPDSTAATPKPALFPYFSPLRSSTSGSTHQVCYETRGSAPSRQFVTSWIGLADASASDENLNFSVVLNETTDSVQYYYTSMTAGSAGELGITRGSDATIGLQNGAGTKAAAYTYRPTGITPASSTGADGAFNPVSNTTLTAGVYNYTTINIPVGVTVTTNGTGVLDLRATGSVTISGTIDVSGSRGGNSAYDGSCTEGPSGGGGATGSPSAPGVDGFDGCRGASAGGSGAAGGASSTARYCANPGGANGGGAAGGICEGGGGGGGYAGGAGGGGFRSGYNGGAGGSAGGSSGAGISIGPAGGGGGVATGSYAGGAGSHSNACDANSGGGGGGGSIGAVAAADLAVTSTFYAGSGGGGGSGPCTCAKPGGGGGGGGGGALSISTPASLTITGALRANGGAGGSIPAGYGSGAGGGGSGGVLALYAPTLNVSGVISAVGGAAGSSAGCGVDGGAGGLGRILLSTTAATCSVTGATITPAPLSGCAAASPTAGAAYVNSYGQASLPAPSSGLTLAAFEIAFTPAGDATCSNVTPCAAVSNATPACWNSGCIIAACVNGFGDCNGTYADGCEHNVTNDPANCGACGAVCNLANVATDTCAASACGVGACSSGFGNCNGVASDGCETNLTNNPNNCSGCGTVCSSNNMASVSCASSVCNGACASGFADCNANKQSDGCEINTTNNASNCGACGTVCSSNNMATVTCSSSVCSGTCTAGFADCNSNLQSDGCEANLLTSATNCGGCGIACSGATPTCSNGSCVPSQCTTATVVNDATRATTNTTGTGGCDYGISGWFRFEGTGGTTIPTSPPPILHCGTSAPGWINGTVPTATGATSSVTACFNWSGNTCNWSDPAQVTNCGGYYVYNLQDTIGCSLRYCTATQNPVNCNQILANNPSATSGTYTIYPTGSAMTAYCLMNPPGAAGGFTQVLDDDTTVAGFPAKSFWAGPSNITTPNNGAYSIVNLLSAVHTGTNYTFYNSYPLLSAYETWTQVQNPTSLSNTNPTLVGAVDISPAGQTTQCGSTPYTGMGGLYLSTDTTYLSGDQTDSCWWFAVGVTSAWGTGIPAYTLSSGTVTVSTTHETLYVK